MDVNVEVEAKSKKMNVDNDKSKSDFINLIYSEMQRVWYNDSFDNIFGVDRSADMLKENIVLPFKFPHLYKKPERAFTLFGAPGSGKSHLLAAAAHASGSKLFLFNLWNLQSKTFIRLQEECLKAVFKVARDNSPSILCFEDTEALSNDGMDTAKTIFLNEMQEFLHHRHDLWDLVVVIALSQAPWKVDPFVRKVFTWSSESHVVLPNEEARSSILKAVCSDMKHSLWPEDFRVLASKSEGFSGSDLKSWVYSASMRWMQRLTKSTHFKKVFVKREKKSTSDKEIKDDGKCKKLLPSQSSESGASCQKDFDGPGKQRSATQAQTGGEGKTLSPKNLHQEESPTHAMPDNDLEEKFSPCDPDDVGAFPMSVYDIPEESILEGKTTMQDMEAELSRAKPSVTPEELEKFILFESEFCTG